MSATVQKFCPKSEETLYTYKTDIKFNTMLAEFCWLHIKDLHNSNAHIINIDFLYCSSIHVE